MTDEPLAPVLRSWLRQRDVPPPASRETAAYVLARLPRIRQRRRWSLLLTPWRRTDRGPSAASPELPAHQPLIDPIPIATRRTIAMLSPATAIIAGALVALGGLFLVVQPSEQAGPGAPAAEVAPVPGVTVTVDQECVDTEDAPEICTWAADDPRLTGTLTHDWVGDISDDREGKDGEARVGFSWLEGSLETPEGTWDARVYVMWTDPVSNLLVLSGTGENEGWHYLATAEGGPPSSWTGIIYEGDLPPFGPPAVPLSE